MTLPCSTSVLAYTQSRKGTDGSEAAGRGATAVSIG
jgi:hypothetical protein